MLPFSMRITVRESFPETPVAVILKEYVDLTSCFYDGAEIRVVNGMLSNIAKAVREADA